MTKNINFSLNSSRSNYAKQLQNITIDDLKYVERDLSIQEKVSLSFLLFGSDKTNAEYILQRLLVLLKNNGSDSDILHSFTKITTNWKPMILEALAIIRSKRILRKLGLQYIELRAIFLPHIPEISLKVNVILKTLYFVCERLSPAQAGKLILDINEKYDCQISFYDHSYLEIFLLHWISKSLIVIGSDMPPKQANLDILIQYAKLNELYEVKELLTSCTKTSKTSSIEKEVEAQWNVRDSAATDHQAQNFDRKDSCPMNSDECYLVRRTTAGFALILNQLEFHQETNPELKDLLPEKPLQQRKGTDADKNTLKSVFSSFGYTVIEKENATHYEILNILREVVSRSIVYDSLIVCILSHGIEGLVYGSNSIPIEISAIETILASDSLLDKPKMLIIQACQGEQLQKAKFVQNLESDAPRPAISVPAFGDMIKAMSTVPGFASVRHTKNGTWFIQSLCRKIDELGDRRHMSDILMTVTREVSNKRGYDNECMIPLTCQTLRKSFYLPKRF